MSDEKTEQATPKKKQDAEKKGQITQSKDLNNGIIFLFIFIILASFGNYTINKIDFMIKHFLSVNLKNVPFDLYLIKAEIFRIILYILSPIFMTVLFFTVAIYGMQTKFAIHEDKIKISLDKLDPIKNFGNIFNKQKLFLPMLIIGKVFALIVIGYVTVKPTFTKEFYFINSKILLERIGSIIITLSIRLSLGIIVIGIFDYLIQWWKLQKSLMMSKEEIKEEFKQDEGSPDVKRKRRQKAYEISQSRMIDNVKNATVTITNPTSIAVSLKYDKGSSSAPKVVAKGKNYLAKKIKDISKENKIPIIENKPLARGLYLNVKLNQEIPAKFFEAVASILAYVYKHSRK